MAGPYVLADQNADQRAAPAAAIETLKGDVLPAAPRLVFGRERFLRKRLGDDLVDFVTEERTTRDNRSDQRAQNTEVRKQQAPRFGLSVALVVISISFSSSTC
jgi:hypothetical protein